MAEDVITENENEQEDELLSSEELELLDQTEVREEDAAQFPQELIVESSEEIPAERRENITQMIMRMSVPEKIRLAMLGNREARKMLIHERNKVVATAVLRSPKLTTSEIQHFAQERGTPEDVILTICKRRTWLKNYQIKLALVTNPKTPLPKAIQFLAHLHDKDLQSLTRNKNVSAAISQNAWQMLRKRKR
jgi:hypothetical protein